MIIVDGFWERPASLFEVAFEPFWSVIGASESSVYSTAVRVEMVQAGVRMLIETWGFGIGPGAFSRYGHEMTGGVASSMHVFPVELMVEMGWLGLVGVVVWLRCIPRQCGFPGWLVGLCLLSLTVSTTSSVVTNYYFIAVAVLLTQGQRHKCKSAVRESQ